MSRNLQNIACDDAKLHEIYPRNHRNSIVEHENNIDHELYRISNVDLLCSKIIYK
jgi:hypothetical protein